jgi:hypothetical protein
MRSFPILALLCITTALAIPVVAAAGGEDEDPAENRREDTGASSLRDRVDDLQQEIESLTEDIEDLGEPVGEFEWFDECAYTIGVSEYGTWNGDVGYLFTGRAGQQQHRPALAIDMRGFGTPQYNFLSFPGEEPPSIECNEDAGEEFIDD